MNEKETVPPTLGINNNWILNPAKTEKSHAMIDLWFVNLIPLLQLLLNSDVCFVTRCFVSTQVIKACFQSWVRNTDGMM